MAKPKRYRNGVGDEAGLARYGPLQVNPSGELGQDICGFAMTLELDECGRLSTTGVNRESAFELRVKRPQQLRCVSVPLSSLRKEIELHKASAKPPKRTGPRSDTRDIRGPVRSCEHLVLLIDVTPNLSPTTGEPQDLKPSLPARSDAIMPAF